MKRFIWSVLMLVAFTSPAWGQSTSVTATITDSDSLVWANGSYSIQFVPVPGVVGPYSWTGGTLTKSFSGTLNSSGVLSISLPDNTTITPPGTQWNFTICPNATTGCFNVTTSISGASQSLTSILSAAAAGPRFQANPSAYGYGTIEISPNPKPGAIFYNTSTGASTQCNQWTGTTWQSCGTGSGTGITALTGDGTATGPGSAALTLATVNTNTGACGDATHSCQVTLNGKGLATAATPVAITAAGSGTVSGQAPNKIPLGTSATVIGNQSSITDNGTTVSTAEPIQAPLEDAGGAVYNVATYGAVAGGGDATTAINAAVAAINAAGNGTLQFPGGKFTSNTCNFTFTVPAKVEGVGSGTSDNTTTYGTSLTCSNSANPGFVFSGNIGMVRDIAIYNSASTPASTAIGVAVTGNTSHQRVSLENAYLWGWYDGVSENGAYWDIGEGSQFVNNVRAGIYVQNTVNQDEGDWNIHNSSCNGGTKTNSSTTPGSSACIYWVSGGGGKITSIKSNATLTDGIYLNCNSCGTNQFLVDNADIENTTNAPIFMTSTSGFTTVSIIGGYLSGPSTYPDIDLDAHIGNVVIADVLLNTYGTSGNQPEAILCANGTTGVLISQNYSSANFTALQSGCGTNVYQPNSSTGTFVSYQGNFQIGCTVGGCANGETINLIESGGTGSIASSYAGNGMTFVLPRTNAGKGFHFQDHSAADLATIDSSSGNLNIKTGAVYQVNATPIILNIPFGTPTYTAGTNVTSVACASGYTCTNTRGELTIVGGTATTGTIATVNFSATLSAAPGVCTVTQNGGAVLFSLGHGTPSSSSFTITAGISVASATVTADYACLP